MDFKTIVAWLKRPNNVFLVAMVLLLVFFTVKTQYSTQKLLEKNTKECNAFWKEQIKDLRGPQYAMPGLPNNTIDLTELGLKEGQE